MRFRWWRRSEPAPRTFSWVEPEFDDTAWSAVSFTDAEDSTGEAWPSGDSWIWDRPKAD